MDRFLPERPLGSWRGGTYSLDTPNFQGEFEGDLYGDPSRTRVNLNNASLPAPSAEVRGLVEEFQARLASTPLSEAAYQDLAAKARGALAPLLGMSAEDVIFGRNTTEAMHWEFWFAKNSPATTVLMSHAECPSIYRMACYNLDHGNPDRKDPLTTYSRQAEAAQYQAVRVLQKHTAADVIVPLGYNRNRDQIWVKETSEHFQRAFGYLPRVILSHVFRHDGHALDIKSFTEAWRALEGNHITIDGAMALGNLPKINVRDLGVDAYGVSPHKTLGALPLGAMAVRRDSEQWQASLAALQDARDHYPVFHGFFPPEWNIAPNTECRLHPAHLFALSAAIKDLRNNQLIIGEGDCTPLYEKRLQAKNHALLCLNRLKGKDHDLNLCDPNSTAMFLSFTLGEPDPREQCFDPFYAEDFPGQRAAAIECKERTIAKTLMEQGFAFTFLRRGKIFRLSFSHRTTEAEISEFFDALEEVLNKK